MFFQKKSKKEDQYCSNCRANVQEKFKFCPYCGESLIDEEKEMKDFGMLGRTDVADEEMIQQALASGFGITEKLLGSLVNSLMRNLDVQVRELNNAEVKNMPNGIKIKIGMPVQKKKENKLINHALTDEQLKRINTLPRAEAKTQIRRLSDKVIYDLTMQGIASSDDIIFSKLESGYEIKAIAKNKVYVNSIPLNLPLKSFALHDKGLTVEFLLQ